MQLNEVISMDWYEQVEGCVEIVNELMEKCDQLEIWNVPEFLSGATEDNDTTSEGESEEEEEVYKVKGNDGVNEKIENEEKETNYHKHCQILNDKLKGVKYSGPKKMKVSVNPVMKKLYTKFESEKLVTKEKYNEFIEDLNENINS